MKSRRQLELEELRSQLVQARQHTAALEQAKQKLMADVADLAEQLTELDAILGRRGRQEREP